MTVTSFHRLASAELKEAIGFYERQPPGLGDRFLAEVAVAHNSREPRYWTGRG